MRQFTLKQWLLRITLVSFGVGLLVCALFPFGNPGVGHEHSRTLELAARTCAFSIGAILFTSAFRGILPEAELQFLFTALLATFIKAWFKEQITFLLRLFFKNFELCVVVALGALAVYEIFRRRRRKKTPDAE